MDKLLHYKKLIDDLVDTKGWYENNIVDREISSYTIATHNKSYSSSDIDKLCNTLGIQLDNLYHILYEDDTCNVTIVYDDYEIILFIGYGSDK